eukprot:5200750-Pyramimonas_sp.AAC.1
MHAPDDNCQCTVRVEEYTVAIARSAAIMLSPAVAKLWWDQYVALAFSPSGRAVALHIGRHWWSEVCFRLCVRSARRAARVRTGG